MQEILKPNDYSLFEHLVSMTQEELHKTMRVYLKSKYKNVIATKDYIVAVGDIPIALVAHMDTVFKSPVKNLYYDQKKGILWSPEGLGADDRAGVFSILQIVRSGFRPSVILTTFEEVGGLGALALSKIPCPISNLKYMIELDRCGTDDCVFYCCDNQEFIDYVSHFGFVEKCGSFSDISYLMPGWQICGVNLSIGYENEHDFIETLHVGSMFATIRKVKKMLQQESIPNFEFIEEKLPSWMKWYTNSNYEGYDFVDQSYLTCDKCGHYFPEYDLFPVKSEKGMKYYCPDCVAEGVNWCEECGQAYEVTKSSHPRLCEDCCKEDKKN